MYIHCIILGDVHDLRECKHCTMLYLNFLSMYIINAYRIHTRERLITTFLLQPCIAFNYCTCIGDTYEHFIFPGNINLRIRITTRLQTLHRPGVHPCKISCTMQATYRIHTLYDIVRYL